MDMLEMYERALERTGTVVAGTRREQFSDPTPCTQWDVHALLNHIVGGCSMYAAAGAGERLDPTAQDVDYTAEEHVGTYQQAAKGALEAFRAPGAMERMFALPPGDTPGSVALGIALADVAVHGWDLAKATGQEASIDDDIAEAVYQMTTQMMAPKGRFPRLTAFKEPVEIGADAAPTDRLVAYLGRRP